MAYEKTTWVDGETEIDAQKLNKMEEGIVEASQTGGILTGTIVAYDGDTIPEGYEEVDNPNTYSTQETFIGYDIEADGTKKPRYRQVINTMTPTATGEKIVQLGGTTVLKKVTGRIMYDNASEWTIPCYYNTNVFCSIQRTINTNSLVFYGSTSTLNQPCEIVIEYNKTTD